MQATAEGTARFADRFPDFRGAAFYRTVRDLTVSSLGIGTYLAVSTEALLAAAANGINFFDAAINYQQQRSERCIGEALQQLQRDEIAVCTKAGFLTKGAVPDFLEKEEVVGGMHSMSPGFLEDQIDRSRANMRVDTIDVFYLHNPETQLGFCTRVQFEDRIRRAFAKLEALADQRKIRWYGARHVGRLPQEGRAEPAALAEIAEQEGGPEHRFRFIQLPFNLGMVEAFVDKPESVLESAARLGIAVVRFGHAVADCGDRQYAGFGSSNPDRARDQCAARDSVHAFDARHLGGAGGDEPHGARVGERRRGPRSPCGARRVSAALPVMTPVDTADTAALEALPNHPAVFVLWPREGRPHLSKTAVLRRRVLRLFKAWNLAGTVDRIEYRLTGSAFESAVVHYEQARRLYPETYLQTIKLRLPPYVKVVLSNEFPRSHISTHLTRSGAMYFGPFGSRTAAERFEGQCLDLFQMRRCQEDLVPSPSHPGCIYGEMAMCLRPCQQVVGAPEYAHEVARVVEFLRTDGRSLLDAIRARATG